MMINIKELHMEFFFCMKRGNSMMRHEILQSLEDINYEESYALANVNDAIIDYYEKQSVVMENCDDIMSYEFPDDIGIFQEASDTSEQKVSGGIPGILRKIWSAIKSFCRMIADAIGNIINKITGKNKDIISVNSIVLDILSKSKYNTPDNTKEWKIPKANTKYIASMPQEEKDFDVLKKAHIKNTDDVVTESASEGKRYITINIPAGKGSVFYPRSIKVPNDDIITAINSKEKTITFHQAGYGKWDKTKGDMISGSTNSTPNVEGTKKPWTHSSKTALYFLKNPKTLKKLTELVDIAIDILFKNKHSHHTKFNLVCKKIINDINHAEKKEKLDSVTVSMKDLTDFQKEINSLLYKIDEFSDINRDVSKFDKATINSFNTLYKKLLDIQVSFNIVTSSFNNTLIIHSKYIGCIKNMTILDEFVNMLIEQGVPPKYIAYNTWLVSDECIRGKGDEYKPLWGQTRFTFFPNNDDRLCYKIAMSGAGITSNRAEIRTSEMFEKMDRVDLIAPVVKHWKNDTIVVMEKIKGNAIPSYATCLTYAKRCNDAIANYEKTHNIKFNITIQDQHKDNVKYDENLKCFRSIDYGVATRSYIKESKKDKKNKK